MTNLTKLKNELAEKYVASAQFDLEYSSFGHSAKIAKEAITWAVQSCLDLLAKQSGEFREFWIDLETKEKHTEYKDISNYFATDSEHVGYTHVIDIAAILSAQARIAKLEEEIALKDLQIKSLAASDTLKKADLLITELQQRNKELESEEKALQTIAKDAVVAANKSLEAFTICDAKYVEACGKIKELEQELVRIKSIVKNYEKRLSNYECHHGYRKDQACISSNCDVANHTKEKL